ncbi:MAG TPA: class I SAM-dependent methyltransferase [Ruminococcaceae bacterium]|nr:class I SAM-dependent methyltransferase [Oscillospiraceae bacterium]
MKEKNAERFTGFADIYEKARPTVPEYPVKIICKYLGKKPDTVVDIGCGTGLSTVVWSSAADNVIGIEPSEDMISAARKKSSDNIKFVQAYGDSTTLESNSADVAVCSQSFHWMEPAATLKEINRILRTNGVFATIDCDWPPVTLWQAEKAYTVLGGKISEIEKNNPEINSTFIRYGKDGHLKNIQNSGYFRYARELLFSNTESCTAERLINIVLSQGGLQTILKKSPELIANDVKIFADTVRSLFGEEKFDVDFCYRMRIGIK